VTTKPVKVLICQFPYGNTTDIHPTNWVTETCLKLERDPRVGRGNYSLWHMSDTPIPMTRNQAAIVAEQGGFDYVLMIESDVVGDVHCPGGVPQRPGAAPFWETAFEFALRHPGPCVVGAPYCGPPPYENVYVFHWTNTQTDDPNANFQIAAYSRNEAAALQGVQPCAALPTGLILISVDGLKRLPHPRFDYEWKNDGPACRHCGQRAPGPRTEKASTEDVYFSRNLSYAGVPQYAAWNCWAGHRKTKIVTAPQPLPQEIVPFWFEKNVAERWGVQPPPVPPATLPARPLPAIAVTFPPPDEACPPPSAYPALPAYTGEAQGANGHAAAPPAGVTRGKRKNRVKGK
jgi:hypothetical protein